MKRIKRKLIRAGLHIYTLHLGAVFLSGGFALAQDVSQPESLTYEIYSSSTAELFWDRSAVPGLNYELRRDGLLLDTIGGVSYLDRTLIQGRTYNYAVVAVDSSGERSTAATVSFTVGGASDVQTLAQPGGLRSALYSSRSAELFWDRPPEVGLTYDVLSGGELIHTTDGVSFYARSLSPGTTYVFQVVAVDEDGNRSLPSSTSFTTSGSALPVVDVPSDGVLSAPSALRAAVYSSRSAELFWDRPQALGLMYEILRNGVPVDTTDGVSFFDRDLMPGTSYTFQVVAIDTLGNRSTPSSVIVNTGGGVVEPETPVNTATAADIQEPTGYFDRDGYDTINVVRLDVRTATTPGVCTVDDDSGCTLDDVKADIDGDDEFTVDIPIHFQGADLPDDGSISNAELRQRGGFTRLAPQKSFRIKLDSKEELWRGERRLQLNKMPYDQSRIRNKMSFDLMQDIPHLPSLLTQFVNLWIDDGEGPEDYGLFTHTEYVGKEYLVNRGWNTDDNVYKIEEFVFALSDLEYLEVDADGEPLDVDRFETRLGIQSGDDHSKVTEMINAVNDQSRSFDSILEQYFDKNNVLAWVTVNFLLHQMDAVTHNFYLYNPVGSDTFYFMPWDYDGTFAVEQKPANSLESEELLRRLYYGFSKGRASNFLDRYYRQPGIYDQIVATAENLRNNYLTDSTISEMAMRYSSVISEYAGRMPDIANNFAYDESNSADFASHVANSYAALINYGIPFPPKWRDIEQIGDSIIFEWKPAHDMTGNVMEYGVEIASSPDFGADDQLLALTGLSDSDAAGYEIDAALIGAGTRYARLIARSTVNPDEFWQIASTRPTIDGEMRIGVMQFTSR